ncbi:MAG TPA: penicillin-binding protein 2 [Patescibacteria group bacterium]|jgi:penicillin-binding protein 2|nr:penicillin-binding protein 2 [Patescibacteria group bacterium]
MWRIPKNPFDINASEAGSGNKDQRHLDWDESALDTQTDLEGFADQTRTQISSRWLTILITLACAGLLFQLFNLQIMQGRSLKALAEGNRLRIQTIIAPRGYILDRYGEQLARNTASFSLIVSPVDVPKDGLDETVEKLATLLNIPKEEINAKLENLNRNSLQQIIIKRDLTQQESILFETRAAEFAGFSVKSIPIREYLNPEVFSHALGYTGIVSDVDLTALQDQGYDSNDFIGKSGIELSYEKYLRGTNGNTQVEVDASGRPIKVLGNVDPQPGDVVKLSIDAGLQEQLYKGFTNIGPNVKGAAVAINPKTGEILALVSVPGFNNNLFAPGISQTDYEALIQDKKLPLFDRAISGTYPPGSTIKLIGAAAALQEGVVNENTVINDRGVLVIPNQYNPSIKYSFYGWKHEGLGPMTVKSAIAESSDIYFYTVAGGHPSSNINGMGPDKLTQYYRQFGMGSLTGIDIQGEKAGLVADPAWKEKYFEDDPISSKWYLGDTYHIAIGQGDMLATPLQVAVWTALIANNGVLNVPHLLKEVTDQSGQKVFEPKLTQFLKPNVSLDNLRIVQAGMREDVAGAHGTGKILNSLPVSSAGKTGTSQFDGADPNRTHAWFTAYAPYENPEIAITVLVEAGGEGHAAAAPIVKNALQWWAENRYGK